jgi:hypothetical protein
MYKYQQYRLTEPIVKGKSFNEVPTFDKLKHITPLENRSDTYDYNG